MPYYIYDLSRPEMTCFGTAVGTGMQLKSQLHQYSYNGQDYAQNNVGKRFIRLRQYFFKEDASYEYTQSEWLLTFELLTSGAN
jgi:hypothetical protein